MHTLYIPKKGKKNRNSDNTRKFSLENIQKHKLKKITKIKMLEIKCKHIFMSISKNTTFKCEGHADSVKILKNNLKQKIS